jgi:hypothetical protein
MTVGDEALVCHHGIIDLNLEAKSFGQYYFKKKRGEK